MDELEKGFIYCQSIQETFVAAFPSYTCLPIPTNFLRIYHPPLFSFSEHFRLTFDLHSTRNLLLCGLRIDSNTRTVFSRFPDEDMLQQVVDGLSAFANDGRGTYLQTSASLANTRTINPTSYKNQRSHHLKLFFSPIRIGESKN